MAGQPNATLAQPLTPPFQSPSVCRVMEHCGRYSDVPGTSRERTIVLAYNYISLGICRRYPTLPVDDAALTLVECKIFRVTLEELRVSPTHEQFAFVVDSLSISGLGSSCDGLASSTPDCDHVPFPKLEILDVHYGCSSQEEWDSFNGMLKNRKDRGYGLKKVLIGLQEGWAQSDKHGEMKRRALESLELDKIFIRVVEP
ncbi:hypothetical protein AX16_003918 [Volvariella volvacea WC 439]|nr:hypothetical protein AX16_003918 [Volvariella volvacea WC 439]